MQQMEDPWHTFIRLRDSMYKGSVVVSSIPFLIYFLVNLLLRFHLDKLFYLRATTLLMRTLFFSISRIGEAGSTLLLMR